MGKRSTPDAKKPTPNSPQPNNRNKTKPNEKSFSSAQPPPGSERRARTTARADRTLTLQRFPAVSDRQSFVLELLYGELRAARRLGLAIESDTYEARFPDLAESLRRQIEVLEWLKVTAEDTESENRPSA